MWRKAGRGEETKRNGGKGEGEEGGRGKRGEGEGGGRKGKREGEKEREEREGVKRQKRGRGGGERGEENREGEREECERKREINCFPLPIQFMRTLPLPELMRPIPLYHLTRDVCEPHPPLPCTRTDSITNNENVVPHVPFQGDFSPDLDSGLW